MSLGPGAGQFGDNNTHCAERTIMIGGEGTRTLWWDSFAYTHEVGSVNPQNLNGKRKD